MQRAKLLTAIMVLLFTFGSASINATEQDITIKANGSRDVKMKIEVDGKDKWKDCLLKIPVAQNDQIKLEIKENKPEIEFKDKKFDKKYKLKLSKGQDIKYSLALEVPTNAIDLEIPFKIKRNIKNGESLQIHIEISRMGNKPDPSKVIMQIANKHEKLVAVNPAPPTPPVVIPNRPIGPKTDEKEKKDQEKQLIKLELEEENRRLFYIRKRILIVKREQLQPKQSKAFDSILKKHKLQLLSRKSLPILGEDTEMVVLRVSQNDRSVNSKLRDLNADRELIKLLGDNDIKWAQKNYTYALDGAFLSEELHSSRLDRESTNWPWGGDFGVNIPKVHDANVRGSKALIIIVDGQMDINQLAIAKAKEKITSMSREPYGPPVNNIAAKMDEKDKTYKQQSDNRSVMEYHGAQVCLLTHQTAPDATINIYKAGSTTQSITSESLAFELNSAFYDSEKKQQPKILSLSLNMLQAGETDQGVEKAIMKFLADQRTTVVVSSGNKKRSNKEYETPRFPATIPGVIVVSASTKAGTLWDKAISPIGKNGFVAPGRSIPVIDQDPRKAQNELNGTSFSVPIISGLVGLMYDHNDNLTRDDILGRLRASCNHKCEGCGNGLPDAYIAVFGNGRERVISTQAPPSQKLLK